VPDDRPAPPYYPTKAGTKLVYDYSRGEGELVFVVTAVKDIKGGKRVSVERRDLNEPVPEAVELTAAGLVRVEGPDGKLDPPQVILPVPFRAGVTWKYKQVESPTGAGAVGTDTVVGVEKVTVPAGTFEAVRVDTDCTYTWRGGVWVLKRSRWYAPHVGMIQEKDKDGNLVLALKSVTLPKE
jgi:hypothetical protein